MNKEEVAVVERQLELTRDVERIKKLKQNTRNKSERLAYSRLEYILTAWLEELVKWHTA